MTSGQKYSIIEGEIFIIKEICMKKPVIEFKDFSFQYRAQAKPTLKNINLTIYEGEKVLIVGPSGSGKSTLFKLLMD